MSMSRLERKLHCTRSRRRQSCEDICSPIGRPAFLKHEQIKSVGRYARLWYKLGRKHLPIPHKRRFCSPNVQFIILCAGNGTMDSNKSVGPPRLNTKGACMGWDSSFNSLLDLSHLDDSNSESHRLVLRVTTNWHDEFK